MGNFVNVQLNPVLNVNPVLIGNLFRLKTCLDWILVPGHTIYTSAFVLPLSFVLLSQKLSLIMSALNLLGFFFIFLKLP